MFTEALCVKRGKYLFVPSAGSLWSKNRTMRREVQECIIRCNVQTKQYTEALHGMDKLVCVLVILYPPLKHEKVPLMC